MTKATPVYTLDDIISYACEQHRGQGRKGTVNGITLPYVVHPIEVTKKLFSWKVADLDMLKAAICHDIIEDCPITLKDLEVVIGKRAAGFVDELTVYPNVKKKDYIKSFSKKSDEALLIKLADRACNTRDFLNCGKDGGEYWLKAKPLVKVFEERATKLIEKFGSGIHLMYRDLKDIHFDCEYEVELTGEFLWAK